MQKSFANAEEMVGDERFLSWFYKESDEKVKNWELWLAENPQNQSLASEAVRLISNLKTEEAPVSSFRVAAAYTKLKSRLEELETDTAPVVDVKPASRKRWWIAAAAAVLIIAAGLLYYQFPDSKEVIQTQYGQLTEQQLPDGSRVMLNANTTITLGKGWKNGHDREVWLKGEAFFQINKTEKKTRFIVHTDQLDVIVTGTQFNVKTLLDKTSVLLTEGSVIVKTTDEKEIFMKPGEYFEILNNNKTDKKTSTNQETILAWKESKLNFDNTPMKEVVTMITNHYGVTVTLGDESIGEKTITGMMSNNNLDDLLKALEATTEFKITRTAKTIVIERP